MSTIIVGYKKVDFNRDGSEVHGYRIYLASEPESENEFGMITDNCFLSSQKFQDANIVKLYKSQAKVLPIYNKYGKINTIREE